MRRGIVTTARKRTRGSSDIHVYSDSSLILKWLTCSFKILASLLRELKNELEMLAQKKIQCEKKIEGKKKSECGIKLLEKMNEWYEKEVEIKKSKVNGLLCILDHLHSLYADSKKEIKADFFSIVIEKTEKQFPELRNGFFSSRVFEDLEVCDELYFNAYYGERENQLTLGRS